jgi:hypothetical protein
MVERIKVTKEYVNEADHDLFEDSMRSDNRRLISKSSTKVQRFPLRHTKFIRESILGTRRNLQGSPGEMPAVLAEFEKAMDEVVKITGEMPERREARFCVLERGRTLWEHYSRAERQTLM